MLPFTCEEAWTERHGGDGSVHLELFPDLPAAWRDTALEAKWEKVRGAPPRRAPARWRSSAREKRIGSSLEAAPTCLVSDAAILPRRWRASTWPRSRSPARRRAGRGRRSGGRVPPRRDGRRRGAASQRPQGGRCARSWKVLPEVGTDPDYPDLTPRDAAAMREFEATRQARRVDGGRARASSASASRSRGGRCRPGAQGVDARAVRHRGRAAACR